MMTVMMMIIMILSDLSMGLKSLSWLALRGRASLHAGFLPFLHLRTQAQLYSIPQLRFKSSSPFAALPLPAELGVAFLSTTSSLRARSMRSEDGSSFVTSSSYSAVCSSTVRNRFGTGVAYCAASGMVEDVDDMSCCGDTDCCCGGEDSML